MTVYRIPSEKFENLAQFLSDLALEAPEENQAQGALVVAALIPAFSTPETPDEIPTSSFRCPKCQALLDVR